MNITKTNAELDAIYNGLKELTSDSTLKFPVKVTYNIVRNKQLLEPISKTLHETVDKAVMEIMGGKKKIEPDDPEYMEIDKSVASLLEETDEVDIYTINFDDLGSADISPKTLDILSFMINELNGNKSN